MEDMGLWLRLWGAPTKGLAQKAQRPSSLRLLYLRPSFGEDPGGTHLRGTHSIKKGRIWYKILLHFSLARDTFRIVCNLMWRFIFSLWKSKRYLFMGIPLLLNLWRMRRCILEGCLFQIQTFPASRRHVLNFNAGMAYLKQAFFFYSAPSQSLGDFLFRRPWFCFAKEIK